MKNNNPKILVSSDKLHNHNKQEEDPSAPAPVFKLRRVVDMSSVSTSTYSTSTKKAPSPHKDYQNNNRKDAHSSPKQGGRDNRPNPKQQDRSGNNGESRHPMHKPYQKPPVSAVNAVRPDTPATTAQNSAPVNRASAEEAAPIQHVSPVVESQQSFEPAPHQEQPPSEAPQIAEQPSGSEAITQPSTEDQSSATPNEQAQGASKQHKHFCAAHPSKKQLRRGPHQTKQPHMSHNTVTHVDLEMENSEAGDDLPAPNFKPNFAVAVSKGNFSDHIYRQRRGVEPKDYEKRYKLMRQAATSRLQPAPAISQQYLSKYQNDVSAQTLKPDELTEYIANVIGIKTDAAKTWIRAFAALDAEYAKSMCRGIRMIKTPLVHTLSLDLGEYTALVTDAAGETHVKFQLHMHTSGQWDTVVSKLKTLAIYSGAILNGEIPPNSEEIFKSASVSLYPQRPKDLATHCSLCAPTEKALNAEKASGHDYACDHVGAVILKLAQLIDKDPLTIYMLRGIQREDLVDRLRVSRSNHDLNTPKPKARKYETPALNAELFKNFFEAKKDITEVPIDIKRGQNTLLERMGNPEPWCSVYNLAGLLQPVLDVASLEAEELAEQLDYARRNTYMRQPAPFFVNYPDFNKLYDYIPPEVCDEMARPLMEGLSDIIKILNTEDSFDSRALARKIRFKKTDTILILNALISMGFLEKDSDDENAKYRITEKYMTHPNNVTEPSKAQELTQAPLDDQV